MSPFQLQNLKDIDLVKFSVYVRFFLPTLVLLFQTDWIRQNCAVQMEKVRENYNSQVQNIKDIKQYGHSQIQSVREQYFEQVRFEEAGVVTRTYEVHDERKGR